MAEMNICFLAKSINLGTKVFIDQYIKTAISCLNTREDILSLAVKLHDNKDEELLIDIVDDNEVVEIDFHGYKFTLILTPKEKV